MAHLTDLADVLRAAGLKVVEVPGWKTRGRPASTGGFNPRGNLWHHTGAKDSNPNSIADDLAYAKWLAKIGRSDLPAPLCQVSIGRDGTVYVCAAGRGNHAGKAKASGPVRAGDGNELYLGWECQNSGSEGWTKAQYDAMVTAGAATSRHYKWPSSANRAHKETSVTGKWDPGLLDMDRFRADIAARMKNPSVQEDDMELSDSIDLGKAAARELGMKKQSVGGALQYASASYVVAQRNERQLRALTAAVKTLATSQGLDPEHVEAAITKAVEESLAGLSITLSTDGADR